MRSPRRRPSCIALFMLSVGWLLPVRCAQAQQQDRKLLDRLQNPDLSMRAEGFDRVFAPVSSGVDKTAAVKPFAFNRAAVTRGGDGTFQTRNFTSGRDGYRSASYTTRTSALAGHGVPQSDRRFDTKTVAVREDPAVNKSAPVRTDRAARQEFIPSGRRQEEIDDLRRRKNLTPDQIREILNKNK